MASAHGQRIAAVMNNELLAANQAANAQLLNSGYTQAQQTIGAGQTSALDALTAGYGTATSDYEAAKAGYQPWIDTGTKALSQYADATGVNGQAGYDAAVGNYQASPGYQYQVDQASDAVARKSSALGTLGGGNTMAAISDRAQNLANQDYSSYLDRLQGLETQGLGATGAVSALTKGQGDLAASLGTGQAGIYTTGAQNTATLQTGLANGLAGNNTQTALGMGQNATNAGQATDAANNANSNLLLGIAGLGVSALTGSAGQKAGTGLLSLFK